MGRIFDGPGIWIVLVVVLLLFGATRLPALARSIGQSTKIFREEMKTDKADPAAQAKPADGAAMTEAEPVTASPEERSAPAKSAEPGKTSKP
jgi:sec-independent protein translocase protein TatA